MKDSTKVKIGMTFAVLIAILFLLMIISAFYTSFKSNNLCEANGYEYGIDFMESNPGYIKCVKYVSYDDGLTYEKKVDLIKVMNK